MGDIEAQEVKDTMKSGMDSAKADAESSGQDAYTVTAPDTGTDVYANAADRDSAAATAREIQSMAAEQPAGAAAVAPAQAPAQSTAPAGLSLSDPKANASRVNDTMSRAPAPGLLDAMPPKAEAPKDNVTTQDVSTPKLSAKDIFHKKYANNVYEKLISQGKEKEAAAFNDWSRSEKGAAYGEAWSKAMMMPESDAHGRVNALVDLYNKQLPDGQYATAKQGEDGQYTVEVRNEKTHALIGSRTATAGDVYQIGAGMLSPAAQYKRMLELEDAKAKQSSEAAREDRKDAREEKKSDTQLKIQELRDAAKEKSDDKRFGAMLKTAGLRHASGGGGRQGGGLRVAKTIETANGFVAVMSDGTQRPITGADGKPAMGMTGKKLAAGLVGKTLNPYGDNGDVAGRVNTMAGDLNGTSKPADQGDAKAYLSGAQSQADFNERVKALKAKGWTKEQIKAAAQ